MTRSHHTDGVDGTRVLIVMAIIVLVIAASAVVVSILGGTQRPPEPPLPDKVDGVETAMFPDRAPDREIELEGFGWVDREAGLVHIPIDAAIDLLLEEEP